MDIIIDVTTLNPVKFHEYPSAVTDRLYKIDCGSDKSDYYIHLKQQLIGFFNANGINAFDDNKIVFELSCYDVENDKNNHIYFGFYDWSLSVGLNVNHLR